jgi:glycosyltransferase involved in cell wall biosynthesis
MRPNSSPAICIIVENEPVPADRRVWQEARALVGAGFRVSVICPKGSGCDSSAETLEGIEIYRYPAWNAQKTAGYVFEYIFALVMQFYLAWKVYARNRFRALLACNPPDTIFLIALAFKPLGVRFVFDHHDLCPELYEAKFKRRGPIYEMLCLLERLTFRTADMSIATNESYRDIAIARGKMKPDRVLVVQTCAALTDVTGTQEILELKRGKPHMVLYVGMMEPQDGVSLLIEAIEYIVKKTCREDTRFILIGSGSELPKLKTLAVRLGVDNFIEFTGLLPHKQVCLYLCVADVCVAPDPLNPLNDKSTMIKTLEYMAFSKPIVLFDLKEGRRAVGEGALYARPDDPIDFANQIEKLLDSESLRRKLGEFGGKRTEEGLNWEAQSAKLIRAFETLIAQEPRS